MDLNFVQILLIAIFFVMVTALLWYFMHERSLLHKQHKMEMGLLESQIELHQCQIQRRLLYLGRYDFLKYNLKEALKPQYQIQL